MKKFLPLDKLPQEAITLSKNYLRYTADQIKAKGCPVCPRGGTVVTGENGYSCAHLTMLREMADSIIHLDDHMKAGGELPTGWSFFSEYGRDKT